MTTFACRAPSLSLQPIVTRPAIWGALAVAFVMLSLPDCCLNGHHRSGVGMDGFAFICHAAR